VDQNLVSRRF